jgi:hypothetical protein
MAIPVLVRVCVWSVVFSIKVVAYTAVGAGVINSLSNRRAAIPPQED